MSRTETEFAGYFIIIEDTGNGGLYPWKFSVVDDRKLEGERTITYSGTSATEEEALFHARVFCVGRVQEEALEFLVKSREESWRKLGVGSANRLKGAYQTEKELEELPYHTRNLNLPEVKS